MKINLKVMMIKNIKILLFIILLGTSLIAKNGTLDTEVLLDANGDGKKDLITYVVMSRVKDPNIHDPYIKIDIKTDKKTYSYKAVWIMYPIIESCGKGCIELSDIRGPDYRDPIEYKYYKIYDDWFYKNECNQNILCYFKDLNATKIPKDTLKVFEKKMSLNIKKNGYIVTNEYLKKYLNKYPLTKTTVTQYNNIAYYLQKQGENQEAIYLLEKILEKYPNRVVAHYNIADAYWAIGKKDEAIKHYKIYIELMKQKGKEEKIPKEVLDRVL